MFINQNKPIQDLRKRINLNIYKDDYFAGRGTVDYLFSADKV